MLELNTALRVVLLLCGIALAISVLIALLNSFFGMTSPGLFVWGVIAPTITNYIYERKYRGCLPRALRVRTVFLYFLVLVFMNIAVFDFGDSELGEIIDWSGVLIFAAFATAAIAYLVFWLAGLRYDDP